MPATTADSDAATGSSSDSEPSSRRGAALTRAALCAIAIIAAAGCSSTRPAPAGDAAAKSTTVAAASTATDASTGANASTGTTASATATATPTSAPAPAPKPAPAIRPVETFDMVWTTVRDQHFDKTLNGVDWNAVRAEFEPKARAAASQNELRIVLSDMLARLGQSHFGVIPADDAEASPTVETQQDIVDNAMPSADAGDAGGAATADSKPAAATGGRGIAGLDIALVEGVPTVTRVTPGLSAARSGVLLGWQLVSVDGRKVEDVLAPMRESLAAEKDPESPHARQLRMILASTGAHLVSGNAGEKSRIVFRDASGGEQEVTLAFEPAPLGSSQFGHLEAFPIEVESRVVELPVEGGKPVKIGYIAFNIWMTGASEALEKGVDAVRGCDGIVIDLRGNPGGIGAMSMGLAGHFVNEPMSLGSMIGRDTTLAFNVTPRKVSGAGKRVRPISKPLAIILDARSASTSEVFAGGLQSVGRARIFGETSAGMALPARAVELPSGDVLMHAVADFTTSTGVRIEGTGVIPDSPVALSRASLNKGVDDVFDGAANWIREQTLAARAAKPTASAAPAQRPSPRERALQRAAGRAAQAAVTNETP